MYSLGFDIGGTKCAVILGRGTLPENPEELILDSFTFATEVARGWRAVVAQLLFEADVLLSRNGVERSEIVGVGISCGGPLDTKRGVVQCPPNLPDWDEVPVAAICRAHFGVNAVLMNDANASALAEWRFGAGRGSENMIFLTFGTGMGAGLILGNRLYEGTNGLAGEAGHIRISEDGPCGYGKCGSFEGFCSGAGIAALARAEAEAMLSRKETHPLFSSRADLPKLTAKSLAGYLDKGDAFALRVYRKSAAQLGRGLAILVDLLNPDTIVIGSVFERNSAFFLSHLMPVLTEEALPEAVGACRILPAVLGDRLGMYAALSILFE